MILMTHARNRTKYICRNLPTRHENAQFYGSIEDCLQQQPVVHGHYMMLQRINAFDTHHKKALITRDPVKGAISEIFHNIPLPDDYYLDPEVILPRIKEREAQQIEMAKLAELIVDYEEVADRFAELWDFFQLPHRQLEPFQPGRTPMPANLDEIYARASGA